MNVKIVALMMFAFVSLVWLVNIDNQRARAHELDMAKLGYCESKAAGLAPSYWEPCEAKK